jgi:spore coat protein A
MTGNRVFGSVRRPHPGALSRKKVSAHTSDPNKQTTVRRVRVLKQPTWKRGMNLARGLGVSIAAIVLLLPLVSFVDTNTSAAVLYPGTIDPMKIPKFVNQLAGAPPAYLPDSETYVDGKLVKQTYTVTMEDNIDGAPILQQILPAGYPKTPIWGYAGTVATAEHPEGVWSVSAPGASFEVIRGVETDVTWVNNIENPNMFAVDPTLHWANPTNIPMDMAMEHAMMGMYPEYPPGYDGTVDPMTNPMGWDAQSIVPAVVHVHGAEVSSWYDGGPNAWFTSSGLFGPTYSLPGAPSDIIAGPNAVLYKYNNEQSATTLWYHDHALGITRTNVMCGLAGFYLLRDPTDPIAPLLPSGKYEVPLAIQDRVFNTDGSFYFPSDGINPEHPYWSPEFFGNVIMVNGLVWPNMNVDQGMYRFRVLDGSNARFYNLAFSNGMPFTVIGSDGGYLRAPVTVTKLLIAPGERYDILVDFRGLAAGTKVIMTNTAKTPYPAGTPPMGKTEGVIMSFSVNGNAAPATGTLPVILNQDLATFPSLPANTVTNRRVLTLTEVMGMNGPLEVLLDGQKWANPVTEKPYVGSTEEWVIVDATADTHPIHTHLATFQLVSRQKFDLPRYLADFYALNAPLSVDQSNPGPPPYVSEPQDLPLANYLQGQPKGPAKTEMGWKDTVQMNTGEVTIFRIKWAPADDLNGDGLYPFDPTSGPGYVWHCHILDHEDNEMMRPFEVQAVPV